MQPAGKISFKYCASYCTFGSFSLLIVQVVHDVERLPDLLRHLALYHVGHLHASHVQESLDVQVVCRKDQLEEGLLIDLRRRKYSILFIATPFLQLRHSFVKFHYTQSIATAD